MLILVEKWLLPWTDGQPLPSLSPFCSGPGLSLFRSLCQTKQGFFMEQCPGLAWAWPSERLSPEMLFYFPFWGPGAQSDPAMTPAPLIHH